MSKKPVLLTRPQICRTYKIADRTLRALEEVKLVQLNWVAVNGLLRAEITPDNEMLLECARIDAPSMKLDRSSFKVYPFERFMFLRFFQMDAGDLYAELVDRGFINPKKLSESFIEDRFGVYTEQVPSALKKCIIEKREPTEKERPLFDTLLRIGRVEHVYNNPHLEQSFELLQDPGVKDLIQVACATSSSTGDVASFLADMFRTDFPPEAVLLYQWLFSDFNAMDTEDINNYLGHVSKAQKAVLVRCMNKPVSTLKAHLGFINDITREEAYDIAKRETIKHMLASLDDTSVEGMQRFHASLKSFMLFVDREDRERTGHMLNTKTALPPLFPAIKVQAVKTTESSIFRLPVAADAKASSN